MNWKQIEPLLGQVSDQQQRVLRYLYAERYTRPYLAAFMGISIQQVMVEEISALRAILEAALTRKKARPAAVEAVGTKQKRVAGAGPS